jgi:hypothetical protein
LGWNPYGRTIGFVLSALLPLIYGLEVPRGIKPLSREK